MGCAVWVCYLFWLSFISTLNRNRTQKRIIYCVMSSCFEQVNNPALLSVTVIPHSSLALPRPFVPYHLLAGHCPCEAGVSESLVAAPRLRVTLPRWGVWLPQRGVESPSQQLDRMAVDRCGVAAGRPGAAWLQLARRTMARIQLTISHIPRSPATASRAQAASTDGGAPNHPPTIAAGAARCA